MLIKRQGAGLEWYLYVESNLLTNILIGLYRSFVDSLKTCLTVKVVPTAWISKFSSHVGATLIRDKVCGLSSSMRAYP
jgi:hypothetical protein